MLAISNHHHHNFSDVHPMNESSTKKVLKPATNINQAIEKFLVQEQQGLTNHPINDKSSPTSHVAPKQAKPVLSKEEDEEEEDDGDGGFRTQASEETIRSTMTLGE